MKHPMKHPMTKRQFTGKHFLCIILGAFGVIITANLALVFFALGSFPGLEVANTYVASQQFDAKRQAQARLGWHSHVRYEHVRYEQGRLVVELVDDAGVAVVPRALRLRVGSATSAREDAVVHPINTGGHYEVVLALRAGSKVIFVDAEAADGTAFSQRHRLVIPQAIPQVIPQVIP